VTHDQEEAFVLGDEVAVLRDGRIVQQAPPVELYARPVDPWVASFVGIANLLPAAATGASAASAVGPVPLERPHHGDVVVLVRPEDLRLQPGAGATVERMDYHGHDCLYSVALDGGPVVRVRVGSVPAHRPGDRVAVRHAGPAAVAYGG
jgi:iron(III) transport system ATP-binding protein